MTSATGSPSGTPTMSGRGSLPAISTDGKRIRSEISRIERELESIAPSDSTRIVELEKELDSVNRDIQTGVNNATRKEKQIFAGYQRDVEVNKKAVEYMRTDSLPYSDAVVLAEGEVGGYNRGKFWKPAAIVGGVLAVGAFGALAYNAWVSDDAQGAVQEGERLAAITAFQGADPTITPPVDVASVAATDIQKIMRSTPYNLDAQIFFKDVYPNLDPKLQAYLVPADDMAMLSDGITARDNPELKNIRVFADKIGGMQIAFDGERVTEEGAIQPYVGRPHAILDSQAHAILTKYPGVK